MSFVLPITVSGIKRSLVGLEGWLRAARESERRYDDRAIAEIIPQEIRAWERDAKFRVLPVQIGTGRPDSLPAPAGFRALTNDAYDYFPGDHAGGLFAVQLRQRPVIAVQRLRLYLGGHLVTEIPPEWFVVNKKSGRFHLLPLAGALRITGMGYASLAQFAFASAGAGYVPGCLHFDYQAGLAPGWEDDGEWGDVSKALTSACALRVLLDISEVFAAGMPRVQVSGDGLGQSLDLDRFERRKSELAAEIEKLTTNLRDQNTSLSLELL